MLRAILLSPLFPMILLILVTVNLVLFHMDTHDLLGKLTAWIALILAFVWQILIKWHNSKNPKKIIKLNSTPHEFREMDEGQQWVTFKACRNVYIYYSFAIPFTLLICLFFAATIFVPIISIGVLGLGQYIVYWTTTHRLVKHI